MIAYEMHGGKFTPEQQNELVNLAWHLVVNNLCEDIHVDPLAFGEAMADFEHADGDDVSDKEHEFFVQHIIVNLGVATGILLAENADHAAETCSQAMELIDDPEFAHYFEVDDAEQ
ncbi:MAG: hypothetical protein R3F54_29875 [Alphaproteobacteria bacterium]